MTSSRPSTVRGLKAPARTRAMRLPRPRWRPQSRYGHSRGWHDGSYWRTRAELSPARWTLDFTVRWRAECGGVPEHHGLGVRRPAEPRRSARQLAAGRTQPGGGLLSTALTHHRRPGVCPGPEPARRRQAAHAGSGDPEVIACVARPVPVVTRYERDNGSVVELA